MTPARTAPLLRGRRGLALTLVALLAATTLAAVPAGAQDPEARGDSLAAEVPEGPAGVTAAPAIPAVTAQGSGLIRLMAGAFDPLTGTAPTPPQIPPVDPAALDRDTHNYWLVQAAGGDFAGTLAAIEAAGGAVDGYVTDDAYVVRATPAQIDVIGASPAVRATVLYQPGWKVPVAVGEYLALLDLEGPQTYVVHVFEAEPDAAAVAAAVGAVDGAEVLAASERVLEVAASAAQLPAIASVAGVEWIEQKPTYVLHNANARWVNDTGVRDVYAATLPSRLTGAGQTAGVADTGVNYTLDDNGNAHAAFRECESADFSTCAEADYTQATPGTATPALMDTVDNDSDHRKMAAYFDLGATGPNPSDDSAHGTHVAGSVVNDTGEQGVPDGNDGMAPGARLVHQNIGSPTGGLALPADAYQLWRQSYRPRDPASVPEDYVPADYANYLPLEDARTHNNSYGTIVPTVSLGNAEAADEFVWEHEDMVIVASAGNSGPGPFQVSAPSISKNVITSGASANGRQPMSSIDSMAIFSSHGGANGRFEVDLATPGQIVVSTKGGTTDGFQYLQGTSMSGPLLTGLATLVREYFWEGYGPGSGAEGATASGFAVGDRDSARRHNPSAAMVRAALVNGAERMRGFYTGDDGAQRSLDGQYPSGGQGFGLVNLERSLFFDDVEGRSTRGQWFHDVYRADADAFAPGAPGLPGTAVREYPIQVAEGEPLSVSLAYTDAPSAIVQGTSVTVNNLDLVVVAPDGTTYAGNNFNTRTSPGADDYASLTGTTRTDTQNPVERVRVPEPQAGTWTVRVRGTSVQAGMQGFALAANGLVSQAGGEAFAPGEPLLADEPGAPAIADVEVTSITADTARVTWTTSEPTTGAVTTTVDGEEVTYVDGYNLGREGYRGLSNATVETSDAFANRPMLGTAHEALLTGLSGGETYELTVQATDLDEQGARATTQLTTTDAVYGADARDIGQLAESPADPVVSFDPILGLGGAGFRTGTQLYAGKSGGNGILGAFMFRLPESVDPSAIRGAAVELTSGHDITNHYKDDVRLFVDLLPEEEFESTWGTQTYTEVREAEADARLNAETGLRRGGGNVYDFAFGCGELAALQETLGTVQDGERRAAFRFDAESSQGTSLFGADFGFNRRSKGADLRPRLVLYTDDGGGGVTDPVQCDAASPAPTVSQVGVQPGLDSTTLESAAVTVTWQTDVPGDSTVLFREQGAQAFTQVGKPGQTTAHSVQVDGLDPMASYEFAVRSTACNGRSSTDDNSGAGYDFFRPVPDPADTTPFFFTGTPADEANKAAMSPTASFGPQPPGAGPPATQKTTALGNTSFAENFLLAYWTGPYTGTLNGPLVLDWFWSSTGVPRNTPVNVTVFADLDRSDGASPVQPDKIVASGSVTVAAGPAPARSVGTIDVIDGSVEVERELVVQVAGSGITTENNLQVSYGSSLVPSQFAVANQPPPPSEGLPLAGPVPPASAEATGLDVDGVPTRTVPTEADVAAGSAACAPLGRTAPVGGDQPGPGQPGSGGQPGDGQPGDGQPGDGQPGDGQPGDGQPGRPGSGPPAVADPGDELRVQRLAGAGRIQTAIELSQAGFPDGAETVVLARADEFPDALTAAALAAEVDGPVLLNPVDVLDGEVAAELDRLGARTVYLAGGEQAQSRAVESAVTGTGRSVERLEGLDRFETAALIAAEVVQLGGPVQQAIVARAEQFPDALAAGNLAAAARTPILLAAPDDVPATTSDALASLLDDGDVVYLAGGTAALDAGVEASLTQDGYGVQRRAGAERYETAALLVTEALAQGATPNPTVLASGANFPDALVAVPVSSALGGVTVLVDPNRLDGSPATAELLSDNAAAVRTLLVAGGPAAVSPAVVDDVTALLGGGG